jgi:hypothetical protein
VSGNVTDPALEMVYFGAFDKTGNFHFNGFNTSGEVFVAVIVHANTGGRTVQYLSTDNTIGFPGGIQVNNDGTISIGDQSGLAIYTYSHHPVARSALRSRRPYSAVQWSP